MSHNLILVLYVMLASFHFLHSQHWANNINTILCPWDFNNIWNKTTTPAQLNVNFCDRTCPTSYNTTHSTNNCLDFCCAPCDCERPRCEIYGTCCPDALRDQQEQIASTYDVKKIKLKCTGIFNEHYLFISSCPHHYSNDIVRNLCETANFDSSKFVETNTRVSDSKTGVAYFNIYCALCNNVTEFEAWNLSILCHHYLKVYKAKTDFELLELSLQEDSDCKLKDVPVNNHFLTCNRFWYQSPIDSCNVTGKWLNYDSDVEYNCLYNVDKVHRIISVDRIIFKNIFCAICNLVGRHACIREEGNVFLFPPFRLLLNIRNRLLTSSDLETRFLHCNNGHRSKSECPTIQCAEGKIYSKNECVSPLSRIRGLGYKLQLVYEYKSLNVINKKSFTHYILDNVLRRLKNWIDGILGDWALETKMEISMSCAKSFKKIMDCCLRNLSGEYHFLPTVTASKFLTEVLTMSLYYFNVHFLADSKRGRDEIENYFAQVLSQGEIEINVNGISLGLKYVSSDVTRDVEDMGICADTKVCLSTGEIQEPPVTNSETMWELKDQFLALTPLLTCPHVSYNQSDFRMETIDPEKPWRKQITLTIGEINLQFKTHKELAMLSIINNNTLKICVDYLKNKIAMLMNVRLKNSIILYQYILTLVCMGVSIICLSFTLLVYLSFSILRNVPGLNNMFLSATLLLSQALLLASSHVKGPSALCTSLGILTHFLWLSMFCWSFLCCFHMYSVFKANNRSQISSFNKKVFFGRVVFSILVPATVVSCVVVFDFLSSDGQRLGYGLSSCYLNSSELIIYSLGIPMACVLVCNMFFFLSSVYEIFKIKHLQSQVNFKKEEMKQICIYVKLSTTTGVFWAIAILSEALDNDPLRFIAIVLNGLQGLFIFVSYICNRRILTLCLQWFSQLKTLTTADTFTTDQGSSTLNSR